MAVNYTEIKIANYALVKIGEAPITDFSEKTKSARHLNIMFPLKRDELLRMHPWGFARKRVSLAKDIIKPLFGYGNQFLIPEDSLKILDIECYSRYSREGDKILTDSDQVKLFYVFRNKDANTWDSTFVSLFSLYLAMDLAWSLKGSRTLRADLREEFSRDLVLARHYSAKESTPNRDLGFDGEGRLIAARSNGRPEGY